MTASDQGPLAEVVVSPGTAAETVVAVHDRLWVGRQCAGVDDGHRLLLDDSSISRRHLEISLEPEDDRACVTDVSTNGTLLNGGRIERAVPMSINHGDRLRVGPFDLEFRSSRFRPRRRDTPASVAPTTVGDAVLVVGDIADYAAITASSTTRDVLATLQELFGRLRRLLADHGGLVSNYVGDAFFAVWDHADTDALHDALEFVLAASSPVGPAAAARLPGGEPIRMGWAVVAGPAAVTALSGGVVTAVGEATNRAFRIAGLAGRGGRAPVLATANIAERLGERLDAGPVESLSLSGRSTPEPVQAVRAVHGRAAIARGGG